MCRSVIPAHSWVHSCAYKNRRTIFHSFPRRPMRDRYGCEFSGVLVLRLFRRRHTSCTAVNTPDPRPHRCPCPLKIGQSYIQYPSNSAKTANHIIHSVPRTRTALVCTTGRRGAGFEHRHDAVTNRTSSSRLRRVGDSDEWAAFASQLDRQAEMHPQEIIICMNQPSTSGERSETVAEPVQYPSTSSVRIQCSAHLLASRWNGSLTGLECCGTSARPESG
jgi:hypothetical protein